MDLNGLPGPRLARALGPAAARAVLGLALALLMGGAPTLGATCPRDCGIHRIKHVIVVMQENRSFDSYFGTYPGAAGLLDRTGHLVQRCNPDPALGGRCAFSYHSSADAEHAEGSAHTGFLQTIRGGHMDGFVTSFSCPEEMDPFCAGDHRPLAHRVMAYHDGREIPNYWSYARHFVLQDHMFSPQASWSLPGHLFLVSGWSAACSRMDDPFSCQNAIDRPSGTPLVVQGHPVSPAPFHYAWTDLTYLLHRAHVSWGYYVSTGGEPDCEDPAATACPYHPQSAATPGIWNPLPSFDTVRRDGELANVRPLASFLGAAQHGTLPSVSWVIPNSRQSEHPPARISDGQAFVTSLVNAVMRGPDWSSTAIFISWDEWGGFYDHVRPPVVDGNGYGLRVPGLVVSPYARRGLIDHQTLSFDAYNKFIEDDFLGGARLDPRHDGRPDPRPTVRESVRLLGDLRRDFDFSRPPRHPLPLPVRPPFR